jgi:lipopolysaccharide export LptBFGC system permease protein LptF
MAIETGELEKLSKWRCLLGGWRGLFLLVIFILATELFSSRVGGDTGAFLFVTFHFIISPLFCITHILITLINSTYQKSSGHKLIYLIPAFITGGIFYILVTGNIRWLEVLRINF